MILTTTMSMHNYNMRNNTETRENIDTIETIVLDEDSDNDSDYSPNRSRKRVKHNNLLINIEDDNTVSNIRAEDAIQQGLILDDIINVLRDSGAKERGKQRPVKHTPPMYD